MKPFIYIIPLIGFVFHINLFAGDASGFSGVDPDGTAKAAIQAERPVKISTIKDTTLKCYKEQLTPLFESLPKRKDSGKSQFTYTWELHKAKTEYLPANSYTRASKIGITYFERKKNTYNGKEYDTENSIKLAYEFYTIDKDHLVVHNGSDGSLVRRPYLAIRVDLEGRDDDLAEKYFSLISEQEYQLRQQYDYRDYDYHAITPGALLPIYTFKPIKINPVYDENLGILISIDVVAENGPAENFWPKPDKEEFIKFVTSSHGKGTFKISKNVLAECLSDIYKETP